MSEHRDSNVGMHLVYDSPEDKEIDRLTKQVAALKAESDALKRENTKLQNEVDELSAHKQARHDQEQRHRKERDAIMAELSAARAELAEARKEIQSERNHCAESDREACQLQDALGCPCEMDNAQEKAMNRIRDLIAAEGELGDLRERLALFEKVKNERDSLLVRCDELERGKEERKTQLSAANDQVQKLQAELTDLREAHGGAVIAQHSAVERAEQAEAQVQSLRRALEETRAELLEWQTCGADVATQKEIVTLRDQVEEFKRNSMNQEAKDHAILMSYDAMRICMALKPHNFTATEVLRWMQMIPYATESSEAVTTELASAPASTSGVRSDAERLDCHGLDTPERVCFYEQDFYVLSNFSSFAVTVFGREFPTSEHAYHWKKFICGNSGIAYAIRNARSAHEAFKIAQLNKPDQRQDWDDVKVGVMREILRAKAGQHEYVKRKLLATGERELVENSWRDDYWGWGPNRNGQNMLGKLWMEIRSELRSADAAMSQRTG